MARTGLIQLLRRLTEEHATADREGLPVEAIRERREFSRRTFLHGAGVAAAGAALASCSNDVIWREPEGARRSLLAGPRIAIVGGGIAGLATALTLLDAGYSSTIYESLTTRIGGRMRSDRPESPGCGSCHSVSRPVSATWADNQVTDIFGEMIDTGHPTMRDLARRYRLTLVDSLAAQPRGTTPTYWYGNGYYTTAQVDADYQAVVPAIKADLHAAGYPTTYATSTAAGRALDAMTVYDWIETRVPGGHSSRLGQLLDTAYTIEYGSDTTDQSSLNLLYLLGYNTSRTFSEFGPSDERFRIAGGIDTLPRAIAADISARGVNIELGRKLKAILKRADGTYELSMDGGGSNVIADMVVLAIPFAVLRNLDYSAAGFDALKLRAISELGAGRNGKLQLQFTSRYWNTSGPWGKSNGSGYGSGFQAIWEPTRGFAGTSGILVDYTGGSATAAAQLNHGYGNAQDNSVLADARRFLAQIEPVFPGITARWNGRAAEAMSHKASTFNCSYSYWRRGQYQAFAGYERVRQGNVFFAGEHTSVDYQGFMEGGASEGVRAGQEIVAAIGRRTAMREFSRRHMLFARG